MPIWIPRDEITADLEDQAKKRLEEITRAADARRRQIASDAESAVNTISHNDVLDRFNSLIDPLIEQGRGQIDTIWNNAKDTPSAISDTARRLVEQAQQGQDATSSSLS